jgi:hypothetical protein
MHLCLACLLPKFDSEEQLVAILLFLTMEWVESPPVFCIMSETTADLSNKCMDDPAYTTKAHCLEPLAKEMDKWNLLPTNNHQADQVGCHS